MKTTPPDQFAAAAAAIAKATEPLKPDGTALVMLLIDGSHCACLEDAIRLPLPERLRIGELLRMWAERIEIGSREKRIVGLSVNGIKVRM